MKAAQAERLHIGIFGPTNAGKSSLINALTLQDVALVSDTPGTTTDPVYKTMELDGVGPVVFIDTAGFDDDSELGEKRLQRTRRTLEQIDVAILVMTDSLEEIRPWRAELIRRDIPTIIVLNKVDLGEYSLLLRALEHELSQEVIAVSALSGQGMDRLRQSLAENYHKTEQLITERVASPGDTVVLVMPQDASAPKGRLIMPQVQTIRELLDRGIVSLVTTPELLATTLDHLKQPPELIITDSQVFEAVYPLVPSETKLTSFSILFADYKGDLDYFVASTQALDNLKPDAKILIAEACTHAPKEEDIGTVKIPNRLKKLFGEGLQFEFVRGQDFPQDLTPYDLVIHCGSCMVNRKLVLSRVAQAKRQGVPMTNYGVTLAKLQGILDRISLPRAR